jgi:crotonobetainyl-CoA:carnitine CoA-transferase CaiB-like acyl-CoA transferase
VPGTQVIDMTTGLLTVIGILAALQSRERTGRGQHVDISLLRASLALMTLPLTRALAGPQPGDELTGVYPCYTVYRCRDGKWLSVGALEPKFWEGVCAALGRPELASRQWEQGEARVHARAAVAVLFASRDRDEWVRVLAGHDVCVEPVLGYDEMSTHPTVAAELLDQPLGSARLRTVAPPVKLSGTAASKTIPPAPGLGEHTDAVLAEAGFTRADIEKMRGAGVLA